MFRVRKRKVGGNKYVFISIILILVIIYVFRMVSPHKASEYPDIIHYDNQGYIYTGTVKGSPIMFNRQRKSSQEGYMLLGRKGTSIEREVYIYEGFREYRRYELLIE